MSDLSATTPSLSRAGTRGMVIVGDYTGVPAAEAARAVRRAALRPGLDRQLGGEAETIGLVLAQEPDAGSEAQRGAMITLYVSAPTAAPQEGEDEQAAEPLVRGEGPSQSQPPAAVAVPVSSRRVRRKRRPGGGSGAAEETRPEVRGGEPPAPRLPETVQDPQWPESEQSEAELAQADPAWDQLTIAMRDVFHTETPRMRHRGVYPRKPLSLQARVGWAWLKAHRSIAILACALPLVWVGLAVTQQQSASRRPLSAAAAHPPSGDPTRIGTATQPRSARRPGLERRRSRERHRRGAVSAPPAEGRSSRARTAGAGQQPPASSSVSAVEQAPAVTEPARGASSQSGGGPFSP